MIRVFQSTFNQTEYWISIPSTPESKRWLLNYLQNHNNFKSGIISHLPRVFPAAPGHPAGLPGGGGGRGVIPAGGGSTHTPESPGAHSLCRSQVCELPLPGPAPGARGSLSPAPAALDLC